MNNNFKIFGKIVQGRKRSVISHKSTDAFLEDTYDSRFFPDRGKTPI
jgi:hypothetical protein